MLSLVHSNVQLRQTSPLPPNARPIESKPSQPADKVDLAQQHDSASVPKWAAVAFAGLGLLAGGAGMVHAQAQVQVAQQPQQATDIMQQLEESSLRQGIQLDFKAPSPIGGGRTISSEDAARMLSQGQRVLLAEVTSSSGPFRGAEPSEVRRETYLTGQSDLESYSRYFTNAKPQNATEKAAQQLKKHVYGQTDLTLLQRPGSNPDRPSLSPFAAARRLEQEKPVTLRTEPDGVLRTEPIEVQLNSLSDVTAVAPDREAVIMRQLDESSLRQGIQLDFKAPSPIGGGRIISSEDAARMLGQGQPVLLAEVTSSSGPFRGAEPSEVRRETTLTGPQDLQSYARYFTNAEPQNATEKAAQQLKKHVYGQTDLTLLQLPGSNLDRPSLSPFEAARRLQQEQPVTMRTEPDGVIRTEPTEVQLNVLGDVNTVTREAGTFVDWQLQPDGTILIVNQH